MFARSLLTQRDADRLRLLDAFGILIGNNDRHYGNISLLIDAAGDWELAPAYQPPLKMQPKPRSAPVGRLSWPLQTCIDPSWWRLH